MTKTAFELFCETNMEVQHGRMKGKETAVQVRGGKWEGPGGGGGIYRTAHVALTLQRGSRGESAMILRLLVQMERGRERRVRRPMRVGRAGVGGRGSGWEPPAS